MRNNTYLKEKLDQIWEKFFADVPRSNHVQICFGRKAGKRLGSIRKVIKNENRNNFDTLIYINGHFKDEFIPTFVIDATIAHELCHYAHGFSSPLPQLSKFPHRGDIVDKELEQRGLKPLEELEQKWLNRHWTKFLKHNTTRS